MFFRRTTVFPRSIHVCHISKRCDDLDGRYRILKALRNRIDETCHRILKPALEYHNIRLYLLCIDQNSYIIVINFSLTVNVRLGGNTLTVPNHRICLGNYKDLHVHKDSCNFQSMFDCGRLLFEIFDISATISIPVCSCHSHFASNHFNNMFYLTSSSRYLSRFTLNLIWPSSGQGMGVTKIQSISFSVRNIFHLALVPVKILASHKYLTGVTTAYSHDCVCAFSDDHLDNDTNADKYLGI